MHPGAHPHELLVHAGFIRALARALASDEHAADDLEQETWRSALAHSPRAEAGTRPWLAAIVRNFARRRTARRLASSPKARQNGRNRCGSLGLLKGGAGE